MYSVCNHFGEIPQAKIHSVAETLDPNWQLIDELLGITMNVPQVLILSCILALDFTVLYGLQLQKAINIDGPKNNQNTKK